jgi:hypothetical protein
MEPAACQHLLDGCIAQTTWSLNFEPGWFTIERMLTLVGEDEW